MSIGVDWGAMAQATNQAVQMAYNAWADNRNLNEARRAATLDYQRNREMTEWVARNQYSWQVDGMRAAGLNPAMMYSNGSMGHTSAASVAHSTPGQMQHMQGGDIVGKFFENKLMRAQTNNAESVAKKNDAESEVAHETAKNIAQDTINKQVNTSLSLVELEHRADKLAGEIAKDKGVAYNQLSQGEQARMRTALMPFASQSLIDLQTAQAYNNYATGSSSVGNLLGKGVGGLFRNIKIGGKTSKATGFFESLAPTAKPRTLPKRFFKKGSSFPTFTNLGFFGRK